MVLFVVDLSSSVQTLCRRAFQVIPPQRNWSRMTLNLIDSLQGCANKVEVGRESVEKQL